MTETFKELFPGLKKLAFKVTWANDGDEVPRVMVNASDVEDFCLDKAKVREAIENELIRLARRKEMGDSFYDDAQTNEIVRIAMAIPSHESAEIARRIKELGL